MNDGSYLLIDAFGDNGSIIGWAFVGVAFAVHGYLLAMAV